MAIAPITNRCRAHKRATGEQCKKSVMRGTTVCRSHGGSAPQVRRKAAERLAVAADEVMATLISIATDHRIKPADRITACRDLLDRAGIGSTRRVQVEARVDPELTAMVEAARARMRAAEAAIHDAEVVEEPMAELLALPVPGGTVHEPPEAYADLNGFDDAL